MRSGSLSRRPTEWRGGNTPPSPAPTGAWTLLGAAAIAQVGISFVDQGLPALTGFVKEGLALSAFQATLLTSTLITGRFLAAYAAGRVADRVGERTLLIWGCAGTGVFVGAAAASPLRLLFVFLFLAGVASSAATPAGGRLIVSAFPRTRHGLALGLRQAAVPVGGLFAAALLPWFAHAGGWRLSVALAGAGAAIAAVPLLLVRTRPRTEPRSPSRLAHTVHRDRTIVLLSVWGCIFVSGQFALLTFLALDFEQRFGISLVAASLYVALVQGAGVAGRVGWGFVSDRMLSRGRKPLLLTLTVVGVAGPAALFAVPDSAPTGVLVAIVVLAGLGCIGFQGLMVAMLADAAGPERVGAATGYATTLLLISIAVTPPLYGLLADVTGSYRVVWGVLAAVLALAAIPAAAIRERAPLPG